MGDEGRTWTFRLRPGVLFHDGTTLDAEAVVFNFRRLLEDDFPHGYGAQRPYLPNFEMIESVEAVGPLEVRFRLKAPSAVFLNNLAMFPASIVSPSAVRTHQEALGVNPAGTGPFRLDAWERDQRIVLRAFDDHWRGRPQLDRVIFIPVAENSIRAQQLVRGEAHITDNLPPAELDALEGQSGLVIQEQQGLNVGYLTMQMERPPLDHLKVRLAIWHAIDKQRLIDVAYSGHGQTSVSLVPPAMWGHAEGLQDRQYDPQRSRELLAEVAAERNLTLPLRMNLFFMEQPRPYMQQPRQIAVFLRDALQQVGIEVKLVPNDYRQHFQRLSAGEHDLGLAGWTTDNVDPDNFLFSLLDKSNINDHGGNNLSRYASEEVHQLLLEAQRETDRGRREQLYRQAQQRIFDDAPIVPLVHTDVRIAQRAEVQGYYLHPSSLVRLRQASIGSGTR
ncbi:MAG: ABC transporter substrate-binding protein [Pirellulaceae bacterium]|nr:ABC transporter substrate-binding protein [Pirellulaceae bacterium]